MVRLSCGVQCARTTLFALNIIFLIFGFSILGLGIYVKINGNFSAIAAAYNITQSLGGLTMQWVGTIIIIVGVFTSCLAAFGCLGAICKNRVFLYSYATLLTLIVLMEFGAVVVILRFRNDLWQSYDSGFEEIFRNAYRNKHNATIEIIEQLEKEFKCCGVDSATDYLKLDLPVPKSCYPQQTHKSFPYTQGCAEAVALWIWKELPWIAVVLGAILFIEIFGIVSSLVLGVAKSHSSNVEIYDQYL
ncbi:unnamed protein product [Rotaria socialis]|uniref:Tetraspanin n=1 Tax=Rotaria socialis TaxID=392032 RepID=A0A820TEW1_9BILA|nr:unnamed protein product [Rotaria socialis]CAF3579704.1 unnamed protein product [Rotaria socialis]CAF4465515.1 unnamed protein product [Rotaria socialis]CAF4651252.1 unnamed protein product [Rotaria socialis]